jgi:hypothetical protein
MAVIVNQNSYVSLADAEAYFLTRLGSDMWSEATPEQKEAALCTATSLLDNMRWCGMTAVEGQPLAFPRKLSFFDPKEGRVVTPDATPARITSAQLELTLHLLESDDALSASTSVDSLSVGPISLTTIRKASAVPVRVLNMVRPLLINNGANLVWRAN